MLHDIQNRLSENAVVTELIISDELMDNADAKRLLHVGDSTLYRWRKRNLIESQLIGNKHYYRKSDLERML
ncbi:hypothetical protein IWX76_000574 [Pedobacter sp. CAN_A7]|uniref:helix-turn-helix domain-containing protein n=1 Tax=Pedobacter sp. CAN_A7 TaxID=2787722 RepID=UPI0018CBB290